MPHRAFPVRSFVKENSNPVEEHISTKRSTHLEMANLLAKGFPSMQVGDGVVQHCLHEPGGKRETLGAASCPLLPPGWQNATGKSGGQGQLSETRSWSSRAEGGRGRTLVTLLSHCAAGPGLTQDPV